MTEEQRLALLARMRGTSAVDLSVLQAAVSVPSGEETVLLTTTPGSANDALWSEFAALGLMNPAAPLDVPVRSKVFAIEPSAKPPIEELLAELRRPEAMTKLLNDLRAEYPKKLISAVHGVRGTPADLAMMLAAIIEMTMRAAISPNLHDDFLNEVMKMAQSMRTL